MGRLTVSKTCTPSTALRTCATCHVYRSFAMVGEEECIYYIRKGSTDLANALHVGPRIGSEVDVDVEVVFGMWKRVEV